MSRAARALPAGGIDSLRYVYGGPGEPGSEVVSRSGRHEAVHAVHRVVERGTTVERELQSRTGCTPDSGMGAAGGGFGPGGQRWAVQTRNASSRPRPAVWSGAQGCAVATTNTVSTQNWPCRVEPKQTTEPGDRDCIAVGRLSLICCSCCGACGRRTPTGRCSAEAVNWAAGSSTACAASTVDPPRPANGARYGRAPPIRPRTPLRRPPATDRRQRHNDPARGGTCGRDCRCSTTCGHRGGDVHPWGGGTARSWRCRSSTRTYRPRARGSRPSPRDTMLPSFFNVYEHPLLPADRAAGIARSWCRHGALSVLAGHVVGQPVAARALVRALAGLT